MAKDHRHKKKCQEQELIVDDTKFNIQVLQANRLHKSVTETD